MGIEEGSNTPDKKKLLGRFIFAGYILACFVWAYCLLVIISGRDKGGVGYVLAIVFFTAWPVLTVLLRFSGIFLMKKKNNDV